MRFQRQREQVTSHGSDRSRVAALVAGPDRLRKYLKMAPTASLKLPKRKPRRSSASSAPARGHAQQDEIGGCEPSSSAPLGLAAYSQVDLLGMWYSPDDIESKKSGRTKLLGSNRRAALRRGARRSSAPSAPAGGVRWRVIYHQSCHISPSYITNYVIHHQLCHIPP